MTTVFTRRVVLASCGSERMRGGVIKGAIKGVIKIKAAGKKGLNSASARFCVGKVARVFALLPLTGLALLLAPPFVGADDSEIQGTEVLTEVFTEALNVEGGVILADNTSAVQPAENISLKAVNSGVTDIDSAEEGKGETGETKDDIAEREATEGLRIKADSGPAPKQAQNIELKAVITDALTPSSFSEESNSKDPQHPPAKSLGLSRDMTPEKLDEVIDRPKTLNTDLVKSSAAERIEVHADGDIAGMLVEPMGQGPMGEDISGVEAAVKELEGPNLETSQGETLVDVDALSDDGVAPLAPVTAGSPSSDDRLASEEKGAADIDDAVDEVLPEIVTEATDASASDRREGDKQSPGLLKKLAQELVGESSPEPQEPLVLLNSEVPPGTSTRLGWSPSVSFMGISAPTAVLVLNGVRAGPTLCLTAAVHGDELNGIEIVRRLLYNIDPNELSGAVIGVPIVNLQGFRRSSRYLPDRRDLNRFFPGNPEGSSAARIAHSFFSEVIDHCDSLIDLHTGSFRRTNLPQLRANLNYPEVADLSSKMGAIVVVQSEGAVGSLRRAAVEHDIPAVTLEAGAPHELQKDAVDHGVKSIETAMDAMGMIKRRRFWQRSAEPVYYQSAWVRARDGGILFSEVALGASVKKGDTLGTVTDPITNVSSGIIAPFDGRVIGMALNQVMFPGFAAYHIGLKASVEDAAESKPLISEGMSPEGSDSLGAEVGGAEKVEGSTADGSKIVPDVIAQERMGRLGAEALQKHNIEAKTATDTPSAPEDISTNAE